MGAINSLVTNIFQHNLLLCSTEEINSYRFTLEQFSFLGDIAYPF